MCFEQCLWLVVGIKILQVHSLFFKVFVFPYEGYFKFFIEIVTMLLLFYIMVFWSQGM